MQPSTKKSSDFLVNYKKIKPRPSIGTRLSSCGTTQVGALRPLVSHAITWAAGVTGGVPVRGYCADAVRSALARPFAEAHSAALALAAARWKREGIRVLLLLTGFCICSALYAWDGQMSTKTSEGTPRLRKTTGGGAAIRRAGPDRFPPARLQRPQISAADRPWSAFSSPRPGCPGSPGRCSS